MERIRLRRKKVEEPFVEFSCRIPSVDELFPIAETRKFIPEWWREMGRTTPLQKQPWDPGTIKTCPAILDVLLGGWVMPLPFDMSFEPDAQGAYRWESAPGSPPVHHHDATQLDGAPYPPGYAIGAIKFEQMWCAKTPPGYSLRISPMPLVFDPPLECFPAIVDTDYHHHLIPVFRFRHMDRGPQTIVPAGTPLCHLTLVNRRDEATIKHRILGAETGTYERRHMFAMNALPGGRRLFPGSYKARGRKWKRENGVLY